MKELICHQCNKVFQRKERNVNKKSNLHFCSRQCKNKHESESRTDEYTNFRYVYTQTKHSSGRKDLDFSITLEDLKRIWEQQEGRCNLSGIPLVFAPTKREKSHGGNTASLDRISSNEGYVPDNIQFVHKVVNDIKGNINENAFVDLCCKIATYAGQRPRDLTITIDSPTAGRYTGEGQPSIPF